MAANPRGQATTRYRTARWVEPLEFLKPEFPVRAILASPMPENPVRVNPHPE